MAEQLIRKGKMTLEEIADCVSSLSFDELKEIEAEVMQLAEPIFYTAHRLNLQYAPTADRQPDTFLIKLLQILAVCSIIPE